MSRRPVDRGGDDDSRPEQHQLPKPDEGDVYIDFEGHPFWTAAEGLFFLFGLLERKSDGQWQFDDFWAHDKETERIKAADLIDRLYQRRKKFPDMHVYHYNHTERSTLSSLVGEGNPVSEVLADLITDGVFVDLYRVVKEALGSTAAKFAVSALLFDYVLTGPISAVSAGLYIASLTGDILSHWGWRLPLANDRFAARRSSNSLAASHICSRAG